MLLFLKAFFSYGRWSAMGKALAVLLLTAPAAWAQPMAVIAYGDSLTAGYGLAEGEGFVPQLQGWLTEQGQDVQVLQGGVSGDTTAGGLARLDWTLTPEVQGIIVTLGGNDMLRGIDPAVSRANLKGILQIAQDRGLAILLVGMPGPSNYGPEYRQAFDAMYPELAAEFGAVFAPSFFEGLGEGSPADLQALFQADGIHPNRDGVALIVAALGPKVLEMIAQIAPRN